MAVLQLFGRRIEGIKLAKSVLSKTMAKVVTCCSECPDSELCGTGHPEKLIGWQVGAAAATAHHCTTTSLCTVRGSLAVNQTLAEYLRYEFTLVLNKGAHTSRPSSELSSHR